MNPRLLAVGALVLTSILWGTTGTAATFAPDAGPLAIGAAALGIGGLLQAAIAVPALRRDRARLRADWRVVLIGGLAVAVYPLAFYSSMHLAGVAIGTTVSLASAPLAAGLLERVVDGTRLTRSWMVAAGLGVVGAALLSASDLEGHAGAGDGTVWGVLLGLVAGATYATYSWAARRLMQVGSSRGASMGAVFGLGGLMLMPVLLVTGAPLVATSEAFAVAAYMALVPMFAGYVLFGFGLAKVGASTATTITLLEPAVAAVLAFVVVGERLGPLGWVGLALIGVVLVLLAFAPSATDDATGEPELEARL
ncbi:EamA family transporter [Demequina zhanjiangensis]|uniref:EamA family transporter n=1 Tax=Demequina zhanjiangensis TaxID=3051659 RepID=A0ABT8G1Q1_9MICO|nr:EamA family transporter [Demequina sp. SYSU T00b26]MDN4473007.1 EamA family transporter [Demequina sp. SYSU T00b26]